MSSSQCHFFPGEIGAASTEEAEENGFEVAQEVPKKEDNEQTKNGPPIAPFITGKATKSALLYEICRTMGPATMMSSVIMPVAGAWVARLT